MTGAEASRHISHPTRSEQNISVGAAQTRTTLNTRLKDLPKAGLGTTRPPLPKTPSAGLLERVSVHNQLLSSSMEATNINRPPQSLASPIRLTHPYAHGLATPRPVHGHGPPAEHLRHIARPQPGCNPYPSTTRPALQRKSSPLAIHGSISTITSASSRGSQPAQKPAPLKNMIHHSHATPARRPQVPGAAPPMIISPLKVMFDNACRGIYSELSHLQSSCTALINRERKEKETLRAHYFHMRRERDAARERLQALEQTSATNPPRRQSPPVKQEEKSPPLQPKSILKKRSRDESEMADSEPSSSSSSCSSSPSRSPSPRTPSPSFLPHRVAISPVDDGSLELIYPGLPEPTSTRVLTSPPPPPISARKMLFFPPPSVSAPCVLMRDRTSTSPSPARSAFPFPEVAPVSRKTCSAPSSPNPDTPSLYVRPALSRATRPASEAKPSDETPPPAKRRRIVHSSSSSFDKFPTLSGNVSRPVSAAGGLSEVKKLPEGTLGEDDMDLESGSDDDSEHEVANAVAVDSSPGPRPAASSLAHFFPSAQPLRHMYSAYACSSQSGNRVNISHN
ncbi:hypothetical protein V5O48_010303 [Marasmius crinis-equi]|uniref:Uncharacterized protein n=1 Tax=Marasmius crinis-equi TaxID=585013 RepID=A0ABR3F924_9AGAR